MLQRTLESMRQINLDNIKVFIIFMENSLQISSEALQRIVNGRKCYMIHKEPTSTVQIGESLPWNFQLPDISMQRRIMRTHDAGIEEIAYISDNFDFMKNARELMSACIFIKYDKVLMYDDFAGYCPDITCRTADQLLERSSAGTMLMKGEQIFADDIPRKEAKGLFIITRKESHDALLKIVFAGRYFGKKHYRHAIDKYTQAILANKKEESKLYGEFDEIFAYIYHDMIHSYIKKYGYKIDLIANVPEKPSKHQRFDRIMCKLSSNLGIERMDERFKYVGSGIDNKTLSSNDRNINTEQAYRFEGSEDALKDKRIALIDDIATTGSTFMNCAKELKKHGAADVICFCLAINQRSCNSCTAGQFELFSNTHKMRFRAKDLKPFYSTGIKSEDYENENANLIGKINNELRNMPIMTDDDAQF